MKISHKLVGGFLIIALISGITGFFGYQGSTQVAELYDESSEVTYSQIMAITESRMLIQDIFLLLNNDHINHGQNIISTENFDELNELENELNSQFNDIVIFDVEEFLPHEEDDDDDDGEGQIELEELDFTLEDLQNEKQIFLANGYNLWEAKSNGFDQQKIDEISTEFYDSKISLLECFEKLLSFNTSLLEIQEEGVESVVEQTSATILFLSSISIIFAIGIGFVASATITIPIRKLERVSKEVSKGNFEVKVELKRNDELGVLSKRFNEMITGIKKVVVLEKELVIEQEKVKKERMTAIGELSANIAHDIRNPLYIIKNSSKIIKKHIPTDKICNEEIKRIDHAVGRISHQITSVLDFVRTNPLKISMIPVRSLIERVIKNMDMPQNIRFELPSKEVKIPLDEVKMETVFYNIFLNAVQAIGEKSGKIKVEFFDSDDSLNIEIENNGPEIPEKNLPKILDALFTTKTEGTGLGLAGTKNIIDQHKGTIRIQGKPVKFIIELPKHSPVKK